MSLQSIIQQIKSATLPGENTALRVGSALEQMDAGKRNISDSLSASDTIDMINAVKLLAVSGTPFLGTIGPATIIPAGNFWAFAVEGTYANAGGIVVGSGEIAIITRVGATFDSVILDVPVRSIDDIEKTSTVGRVDTYTITYTDGSTPTTFEVTNGDDSFMDKLEIGKETISFTSSNYYIAKSTTLGTVPTLVASSQWNLSAAIPVDPTDVIIRKGSAVTETSATAEIHCLDIDGKYLGYINKNLTSYQVAVSEMPLGTRILRVNSATIYTGEFSISKTAFIASESVKGLENMSTINKLVITDNAFSRSVLGYLNVSGAEVIGSAAWKLTPYVKVYEGQKVYYTGFTSAAVYPIFGYDSKFNMVISLSAQGNFTDKEITIPAGVDYIRASARNSVGDNQRLVSTNFDENKVDSNTIAKSFVNDTFFPAKTWVRAGESVALNINGFVNKHPKDYSRDTFFNAPLGNEDFIKITPTIDTAIPIRQRQPNNVSVVLGNVNLKVALNANSPASPLYFMHFGDSTVKGTVNSGIEGAMINEISRRLTGVGYNLTPTTAPAALSLVNLNFIGTIGNQAIKHEGRGGWSFSDYLTLASKSGSNNAFWNTGISGSVKFDLGYYLTQNNFTAVDSTASNLVILCQLGWNDVFTYSAAQIEAFAKQWLDLIKVQKTGVRVKLISMQLPPIDVYKDYGTSVRQQSYVSTMQRVFTIAKIYEKIAADPLYSPWVEHISPMGLFFPDNAYPTQSISVNRRDTNNKLVYTDDVHPVAAGYAQMADTLFYNILYNFCQ